jgi:hypothetical protein
MDTEARKGCLLLVLFFGIPVVCLFDAILGNRGEDSDRARVEGHDAGASQPASERDILWAQYNDAQARQDHSRAKQLLAELQRLDCRDTEKEKEKEKRLRAASDQREPEPSAPSAGAASGGGEGEPSSTPWPVLVAILGVTVLVPIGFLVWLIVTVSQGRRIWLCPECKSPAPFLHSCGICGFEMPGFRKLMAFCGIVLVILLLAVVLVWAARSIDSFIGEPTPEEDQKAPATSSLPPRPRDHGHPAEGLWCSVLAPALRQGAYACATRS